METKVLKIHSFRIHTRPDRSDQDFNVIGEVILGDCYKLQKLAKVLNPKVILDVGGHIGTFGVVAKKLWPDAELIAIEPNEISYHLYHRNMAEHGYTNYHILNKAISYDPDATYLMDGIRATGGGFVRTKKAAEKAAKGGTYSIFQSNVSLTTVEELIDQFKVKSFDLAKWDCEGGERDAFSNMTKVSARKFGYMVGEYHMDGGAPSIVKLIEGKCPHLKVKAKGSRHIGPFWVFPKDKVFNV